MQAEKYVLSGLVNRPVLEHSIAPSILVECRDRSNRSIKAVRRPGTATSPSPKRE